MSAFSGYEISDTASAIAYRVALALGKSAVETGAIGLVMHLGMIGASAAPLPRGVKIKRKHRAAMLEYYALRHIASAWPKDVPRPRIAEQLRAIESDARRVLAKSALFAGLARVPIDWAAVEGLSAPSISERVPIPEWVVAHLTSRAQTVTVDDLLEPLDKAPGGVLDEAAQTAMGRRIKWLVRGLGVSEAYESTMGAGMMTGYLIGRALLGTGEMPHSYSQPSEVFENSGRILDLADAYSVEDLPASMPVLAALEAAASHWARSTAMSDIRSGREHARLTVGFGFLMSVAEHSLFGGGGFR